MAKSIDTAATVPVTTSRGGFVVQEFSYFGAIKAIKVINVILAKVRAAGSIDDLFKGLFEAAEADGQRKMNTDKLLTVIQLLLSIVGDDAEMIPQLIVLSVRDNDTKTPFKLDDIEKFKLDDIVKLLKAIYEVNWVKGSLKNVFEELGLTAAQVEASNAASQTSPTVALKPLPTPASN